MKSSDVRKKFIEFYKARGHAEVPSAKLVPENDPTTLFTSSGMQPLIPYLLGLPHPLGKRIVDSQKSFRAQDIDEVGDNRHTTFFEMLGNWSLGDYFKKEQLLWIFEFLTKELRLDPYRLYVSVFQGEGAVSKDEESISLWKSIFKGVGLEAKVGERICMYPAKKNWWSRSGEPENMPPGEPGGPDSEVFYDFGAELHLHERSEYKNEPCHPNCDCGRFMEIANSVFMQYQKQEDGSLKELSQKNVDFGGGLERMTAATEHTPDVFTTDLFSSIVQTIELSTKTKYGKNEKETRAMRIIADHLKAATFMIADGVMPGNKQQGYVLRRLIRRAAVKMHQLNGSFSKVELGKQICRSVGEIYSDVYFQTKTPEFTCIGSIVGEELDKFERVLHKGIAVLGKQQEVTGKFAFDLLQSYGFPWELTYELALEKGQQVHKDEFTAEFKKHQELSRTAAAGMFKGGLADQSIETTKLHTATHLLHQALRQVLGTHVQQKGSNITTHRLRFDFSHQGKLSVEEIKQVEDIVNEQIKKKLTVSFEISTYEHAVKHGALAFFGQKYPEKVKVYTIASVDGEYFSREVCGGPHVERTDVLGTFSIIKEESASSGIRRIYATVTKSS